MTKGRPFRVIIQEQERKAADYDRLKAENEALHLVVWAAEAGLKEYRTRAEAAEGHQVMSRQVLIAGFNARIAELQAENERLREALEPFARFAMKREEIYLKRGGKSESFSDSHPSYDIDAGKRELPLGVWRKAIAALSRLDTSKTEPTP